jgi:LPXTG-motif cell wall-anchored protein
VNQTSFPSSRRRLRRLAVVATGALLGLGGVFAVAAPAFAHNGLVSGEGDCATDNGWTATITLTHDWRKDPATVKSVEVTGGGQQLTLEGIQVGTTLQRAGRDGDSATGTVAVPAGVDSIHVKIGLKWRDHYPTKGYKYVETDVYPKTDCAPPTTPPVTESPSPSPSPSASESTPAETPSAPASETPSPVPGAGGGGPSLPTTGASIGTAVGIAAVLLAAGTGLFFFFRRRRIRFTA